MFRLPLDELVMKAEQFNKNRNFQIPKNHKFIYGDIPIMNGKYPMVSFFSEGKLAHEDICRKICEN